MSLPATFWLPEDTPLLHARVPGHMYLDVVLYRGSDWPTEWTPKAVWGRDDLRSMKVSYIETKPNLRNQPNVRNIIEVAARWSSFDPSGHRVRGGAGYWSLGPAEAVGDLSDAAQYRRTTVDTEDLAWMLHHWKPDLESSLNKWWASHREFCVNWGLHENDISMMDAAIAAAPKVKSPWTPVKAQS